MSNVFELLSISRSASDGSWESLCIYLELFNGETKRFRSENEPDRSEDEALSDLMDFVKL